MNKIKSQFKNNSSIGQHYETSHYMQTLELLALLAILMVYWTVLNVLVFQKGQSCVFSDSFGHRVSFAFCTLVLTDNFHFRCITTILWKNKK